MLISIAHVIIIIKSDVSIFPIVFIFFRGSVPEMIVASYSVTYCIYVPGKPGYCFHCYCAVYDECKYSDTFWLADRTRLFVQYTISLSSLCKLIWRYWTYEMPVRYILSSVWIILSTFSPLSIIQYVGLYVFSLPISLVMIEKIYIIGLIIIVKSEVWIITHCLGLGHGTMVSAVCLFIFLQPSASPSPSPSHPYPRPHPHPHSFIHCTTSAPSEIYFTFLQICRENHVI